MITWQCYMLPGRHKLEKQFCAPLQAFPVPPSSWWRQQGEYYQLVGQRRIAVCSENEGGLSHCHYWTFYEAFIQSALHGGRLGAYNGGAFHLMCWHSPLLLLHCMEWWGGESASGEGSEGEKPRRPHSRFSNACNFAIMYIIVKNPCSCIFN